jgi:predicted ester cyclase
MSQGKVEVLDEIMVEDFIDHGETLLGSPRGLDTLKQSIRGSRDVFLDLTVTLHDVIASGDMVGVRGTMRCTQQGEFLGVPATGNEISWSGLAMFRVVDGKIAERWFNSDSLNIVQQLGIVPRL